MPRPRSKVSKFKIIIRGHTDTRPRRTDRSTRTTEVTAMVMEFDQSKGVIDIEQYRRGTDPNNCDINNCSSAALQIWSDMRGMPIASEITVDALYT